MQDYEYLSTELVYEATLHQDFYSDSNNYKSFLQIEQKMKERDLNSILYNSDYYKAILMFGVLLAVLTILLNLWLIPAYGLDGAAIASFSALFIYNTLKLAYVRWKFKILPFTTETWQVGIISMVLGVGFYYIDFPFHAVINIILKGILITTLFVGLLYKFKISEDLYTLLTRILSKVKR